MSKFNKTILPTFIFSFILISMLGFKVSASETTSPTTLLKVSKVASAVKGEATDITVTTANIFEVGNYFGQTKVLFEVSGLDFKNNSYYAAFGDNQTNYHISRKTDTVGFFSRYIDNATEGNVDFTITIKGSNYSSTVEFSPVTLSTYLKTSFSTGVAELNSKTTTVHYKDLQPYINVNIPKTYNTDNVTVKLLSSTGEVYAVSSASVNRPGSYESTTYDTRYNKIYSIEPGYELNCQVKNLYASLFCGKELTAGSYSVGIYDSQKNLIVTLPNTVSVTTKPYVTVSPYTSEFPQLTVGSTEVYGEVSVSGGNLNDYNLGLYDRNNVIIAKSGGLYKVTSAGGNRASAAYKLLLENGKTITEGQYELRLITNVDCLTEGNYELGLYDNNSNIRIHKVEAPNPKFANTIVYSSGFDSNKQYKAVLKQNNVVIAEKVVKSFGNTFDIEFTNTSGEVLPLVNNTSYSVNILDKSDNGDWETYGASGYFYVNYQEESTGSTNYNYGYASFSSGNLSGYISLKNDIASNITDISKFKIIATSVLGQEYVYDQLTVRKNIYAENITYGLVQPILSNMPKGFYTMKAYYNGAELIINNENIVQSSYPAEYNEEPSIAYSYSNVGNRSFVSTIWVDGMTNVVNPQLKLYSMDNLSVNPNYTINLVSEEGKYVIKASQTPNVDFFKKYSGVVYVNGAPIGTLGNNDYFGPIDMTVDSNTYTVTIVQAAHGTLTASVTSGTKGTEVYIKNMPSNGYQFKPGSLKVNGVSVLGRSFVLTGNVTVSAEFEPAPAPEYKTDINNDSITDLTDLEIVSSFYGSTTEDEEWNDSADINKDGIVDIFDIVGCATDVE